MKNLKRIYAILTLAAAFSAGAFLSAQVRDWHDLDRVHDRVVESIQMMERARAANHYDMQGHGAKAEEHLHAAERELNMAIQASRRH